MQPDTLSAGAPPPANTMDNPQHAYPPPHQLQPHLHPHLYPQLPAVPPFHSPPLQTSPLALTNHPHTSPTSAAKGTTDRARAYKSRNKRPCDFCRYKKAACHLETSPPCELCIRYNKECTFVESPAKRRRPNENGDKNVDGAYKHRYSDTMDSTLPLDNGGMGSLDMHHDMMPWEGGAITAHFPMPGMSMVGEGGIPHDFAFDPQLYQEPLSFETFDQLSASTGAINGIAMEQRVGRRQDCSSMDTTVSLDSQSAALPANNLQLPFDSTSGEPSLDRQNTSNAQIVGISGESDPYLLAKYRYDKFNEAIFQSVRMRKMSSGPFQNDSSIPAFFEIQHNALASRAQPQPIDGHERWRRELEEMVSDNVGRRLIQLFYKYVQPYFPLLDHEDAIGAVEPRQIPPYILAAVYGHALSFCTWDDSLCAEMYTPPSADALFATAWQSCQPVLHTPSISVMQTLLLLVQRRPVNRHVSDTPFKWTLMSSAVSIAQAMGLNRDPTAWPLPSWEIKQRKRLAWATFVQDKWLALSFGRSSHIQPDDWDVPPLVEEDFPEADRSVDNTKDGSSACIHFIKLCELTIIVDDILRDLFTIKATGQLHNSLEATLEVAKPLRIRLTEWYQALPPGLLPNQPGAEYSTGSPKSGRQPLFQHELDGSGSLQLAYITAKIELFRAMLRPQVTDANAAAVTALRTGALAVAREISEFVESLNMRHLEAFWASYARTNFTIASSFMLLLFVTSPTVMDAKQCLALLSAWRTLLTIKSQSCDLLNMALLRLDGVFVTGMETLIELSPAAQQAWAEGGQGK